MEPEFRPKILVSRQEWESQAHRGVGLEVFVEVPFQEFASWRDVPKPLSAAPLAIICDGTETEWPASLFFLKSERPIEVIVRPAHGADLVAFIDYYPYWFLDRLYLDFYADRGPQGERWSTRKVDTALAQIVKKYSWYYFRTPDDSAIGRLVDLGSFELRAHFTENLKKQSFESPEITIVLSSSTANKDQLTTTWNDLVKQDFALSKVELIVCASSERKFFDAVTALSTSSDFGAITYTESLPQLSKPAHLRNLGASLAGSSNYLFLDAGARLRPDFLSSVVDSLKHSSHATLTGALSGTIAVRRWLFKRNGRFDSRYASDVFACLDFSYLCSKHGQVASAKEEFALLFEKAPAFSEVDRERLFLKNLDRSLFSGTSAFARCLTKLGFGTARPQASSRP